MADIKNIVYAGNIRNVKVGTVLTLIDNGVEDTVRITSLGNGSVGFEYVGGDSDGCTDCYDINCFQETREDENEADQRFFFKDDFIAGDVALLNVKRNVIVLTGTMEEVTEKVLAIRQGTGAKGVAELRVVPTSAFKAVKLGLVL